MVGWWEGRCTDGNNNNTPGPSAAAAAAVAGLVSSVVAVCQAGSGVCVSEARVQQSACGKTAGQVLLCGSCSHLGSLERETCCWGTHPSPQAASFSRAAGSNTNKQPQAASPNTTQQPQEEAHTQTPAPNPAGFVLLSAFAHSPTHSAACNCAAIPNSPPPSPVRAAHSVVGAAGAAALRHHLRKLRPACAAARGAQPRTPLPRHDEPHRGRGAPCFEQLRAQLQSAASSLRPRRLGAAQPRWWRSRTWRGRSLAPARGA